MPLSEAHELALQSYRREGVAILHDFVPPGLLRMLRAT